MATTIATMTVIKIAAKQIAAVAIITFVAKEIAILIERTLSVD